MTFDEALSKFELAARMIESERPELRGIVQGARATASRIASRFRVDKDARRADRELAVLLLDMVEATERHTGVQGSMPHEGVGGPPSFETMERVRASSRAGLGIAGVGDTRTFAGDLLGGALSGIVRTVSFTRGNAYVNWLLEVFGGPKIDIELKQPIGTVTVDPWPGDPVRATAVLATAALVTLMTVWAVVRACSCRPCPQRSAA